MPTKISTLSAVENAAQSLGLLLDPWQLAPASTGNSVTCSTIRDLAGRVIRVAVSNTGDLFCHGRPAEQWDAASSADAIARALEAAPSPVAPLRMDIVLADAPAPLGELFVEMSLEENRLASYLATKPPGFTILAGSHSWHLDLDNGSTPSLSLVHGLVEDCEIKQEDSRFDADLSHVDITEGDLLDYIRTVRAIADDFVQGVPWPSRASVADANAHVHQVCSLAGTTLSLPDGRSIDLLKVQAALNLGFQETGDLDIMRACDDLANITGYEQGPSGEFVPRSQDMRSHPDEASSPRERQR